MKKTLLLILTAGLFVFSIALNLYSVTGEPSVCPLHREIKIHNPLDYEAMALVTITMEYVYCGDYDRSLGIANSIEDPYIKAKVLGRIADRLVKLGEKEKAIELCGQISSIADGHDNDMSKVTLLLDTADRYINLGAIDKALPVLTVAKEAAGQISSMQEKAGMLSDIALKLSGAGENKSAVELAESIEGTVVKYGTQIKIAYDYIIKSGDSKEGGELLFRLLSGVAQMERSSIKFRLLGEMAQVYIDTGNMSKAMELFSHMHLEAEKMQFDTFRAKAKTRMIDKYISIDEHDRAYAIARTIRNAAFRSKPMAKVASAYAQKGMLEAALNIANKIGEASERTIVLSKISSGHASAGNMEKAGELYKRIINEIEKIDDDINKGYAFEKITETFIEGRLFDYAIEMVKTIDVVSDKTAVLGDIASGLSDAGSGKKAVETADMIEDIPFKTYLYLEIAKDFMDSGKKRHCMKVLSRSVKLVDYIPEDLFRAEFYEDIGVIYSELGKNKKTSKLLSRAHELVEDYKIAAGEGSPAEKTHVKSRALAGLATAYCKAGQEEIATRLYDDAVALVLKEVHTHPEDDLEEETHGNRQ